MRDRLYRLALRLIGEQTEAEDVVQETMIKIWEDRDKLARINNLEGWCTRLVRNLGIDRLRVKQRRPSLDIEKAFHLTDDRPDVHRQVETKESMAEIERLLLSMPEQRRLVIHLREIEGLSYKEIASQLDISLDQVRTDIHRGRLYLRKALRKGQYHE
ncbi:MAG: sigma-70 family RNA polymerase sigma factor [Bacteroidota bacterium]